ncbi:N-6 DNA methylase [Mycobacterium tuberculosis]|nr:N-6 DNA methylase [Mycobacterium tuberculosis]
MQQARLPFEEPEAGSGRPGDALNSLADDETIDYITGDPVKLKGNEPVRQRIARALFHEYGISVDDMEAGFPIPVQSDGSRRKTKKADIAIFAPGSKHELENLRRVVICKPEPKAGKTVTKIRTYEQASADLLELETLLGTDATPEARYGMWTNGLDFFFLYKESGRFGAKFEKRTNWPPSEESINSGTVASVARLRRGEASMLKTAFRRCHNYIHGNEGMPKDRAFWQFLYLLFTKMYDERVGRQEGRPSLFYVLPDEPFNDEGRAAIRARILRLFEEVKERYPHFDDSDVIRLSPRALAFIVGELAPYDLSGTDMDVKGIAYQELVGTNLRGDRGQYFTPKGAVELMVRILDPQDDEMVLDPSCGTGGFLRETLRHQLNRWRDQENTLGLPDTEDQLLDHQKRLAEYASEKLFGADFDESLVRATQMSIMTFTGESGNVYYMDSLLFPRGDYPGVKQASERIPVPGSVDIVMTNPPFGTDIKVEDRDVLDQFRNGIARSWSRDRETNELIEGINDVTAVPPEHLFIQRAVEWVRPGGRVGIVLPNGTLSNPGSTHSAIRRWILDNCWVLASIELPVETFIVDANVNILTSLLFLKKKTEREKMTEMLSGDEQDYPVFMAVAEKVGVDRRGNTVYKRHPDGEVVLESIEEKERVRIGGKEVERKLVRKQKVIDNDLPVIAEAYKRFRDKHEEPGEPR